jgi:hypothetical protein
LVWHHVRAGVSTEVLIVNEAPSFWHRLIFVAMRSSVAVIAFRTPLGQGNFARVVRATCGWSP